MSGGRIRALDAVSGMEDAWVMFNPLYTSFIPDFDRSFDRGFASNLDYYVDRPGEGEAFERIQASSLLSHGGPGDSRGYIIKGPVGSGKTTFVRYLCRKIIPEMRPKCIAIYLDVWRLPEDRDPRQVFDRRFHDAVESSVSGGHGRPFANQGAYYSAMCKYHGYEDEFRGRIVEYRRYASVKDVIRFLRNLDDFERLLVVIDNIDENSAGVKKAGESFALDLLGELREGSGNTGCVLIPVRDYTISNFHSTERFAQLRLPPIRESEVVKAKLREAHDRIKSAIRPLIHEITPITRIRGLRQSIGRLARMTLTRDKAVQFVVDLSGLLASEQEPDVLRLMRRLSAGNMKILVGNVFNLIHSNKLPLQGLFEKVFGVGVFQETTTRRKLVSHDVAIECLMAIHYPFFDVKETHIVNLFNLASSRVEGDYANALVMPRLLFFVSNLGGTTWGHLRKRLNEFGYEDAYVKIGMNTLMHYGLISAEHGRIVGHFEDATKLDVTEAAHEYAVDLICNPSYLQYVCEDTPMPKEYVVSIEEKYRVEDAAGNKKARMAGVRLFVQFLQQEENSELREVVQAKGVDEGAFLLEASARDCRGHGIRISEQMIESVLPQVKRIESDEHAVA